MAPLSPYPTATLSCLHRPDGSASFTYNSTQILASVNGPMEIRARDEHYSKAVLEIIVRPSIGVATYREKYLESRLRGALEPIVLKSMAPRTLIQVVVQIVQVGELGVKKVGATNANEYNPLLLLPSLITPSLLALLDAGVPLTSTLDIFLVTINPSDTTDDLDSKIHINSYTNPSLLYTSTSTHVLAYSTSISFPPDWRAREGPYYLTDEAVPDTINDSPQQGDLVLVESEGSFTWEEWERVEWLTRRECMGLSRRGCVDVDMDVDERVEMELGEGGGGRKWGKGMMARLVREVVGNKVGRELRWRK
ncbi:ribosomal protein S5 domain 2-type protein [Tirmania nivea]|nr:ribosomal protein S5 domain 2-type protein [Tirmania nivea]